MSTVVLDAYSKAYPLIANRIRASVFLESDPAALVASQIDNTAGHPARIWHFPGLPRNNYGFSLDEINGSGDPINNLALFSVVPSNIDGLLSRDDEQIKVGETPGFDAGLQTVIFDGTETSPGSGLFKPNYIGWQIVPSELTQRGILAVDLDYTWNSTTGEMNWIQPGDTLPAGMIYNIHFNPIVSTAGGSVPTINDFTSRVVTDDETLVVSDFGNNIIIEPISSYIELILPDITTVPQGRVLSLEMSPAIGNNFQCARILQGGAEDIVFLRGNIFMMSNERIQIYRFKRDDDTNEWRVKYFEGNFKTVGTSVENDDIQSDVICMQLLDGSIKTITQFARIYEEYVLNLPAAQVVDFDNWSLGNNKYYFSRANSSDPGNAGKFHFPDRRNMFMRANKAGKKAGDFIEGSIKQQTTTITAPLVQHTSSGSTKGFTDGPPGGSGTVTIPITINGGTETAPDHYFNNKYILI